MIFFGILDRLKAKYIFSGALLLLFLLPVLGMALPGGVQHPATPERQTPPDSTPTQAVQKFPPRNPPGDSAPSTGSRPPPDRRNTYGRGAGFAFRHQDRLDLRSASPLADRPRRQYGSHRQRLAATRFVASGHDPARYDPEKIFPGRHHQRQKPGLALLRRTQPHGLYLQPGRYQLPEHESQGRFHAGQYGRKDHLRPRQARHDRRQTDSYQPHFTEGAANPYTMDTITYNIGSKKGEKSKAWRLRRATAG